MSVRLIPAAVAALLLSVSPVLAQDLEVYDQQGFSGGYAEGAYGPLGSEQLYPFDMQDPWMHGYNQYMPFYGAYKHFRPYNYKQVSAQSQTAAGWGMSPRMPYSQQYWHRYHERGTMSNGASTAQNSLLVHPQPRVFGNRVDKNRPIEQPSEVHGTPDYAPFQMAPPVQHQPTPYYNTPAPAPNSGNPVMPPAPSSPMRAPSFAPMSGQSYGVSYEQPSVELEGGYQQQPVLMVP